MTDYDDIPHLEGGEQEQAEENQEAEEERHNGDADELSIKLTTSSQTTINHTQQQSTLSPPSSLAAEDPEIAEMKRRVRELEQEEEMINAATLSASVSQNNSSSSSSSSFSAVDLDSRSVYVGNVDYSSTKEELDSLFSACGLVNRVTILCDKVTGHPKGFAYIEFADPSSVQHATLLNDTEFKGRQLKVTPKRTNLPAFQLGRGRGRGRGGYTGSSYFPRGRGSYAPIRGRGYRGRGRGSHGYAPY